MEFPSKTKLMTALMKLLPGHKWTVHHKQGVLDPIIMTATGIKTAGFNRLSTIRITVRKRGDLIWYDSKSAGYGKNAPWLFENSDLTLAKSVRNLQKKYERAASKYAIHASDIENSRMKEPPNGN